MKYYNEELVKVRVGKTYKLMTMEQLRVYREDIDLKRQLKLQNRGQRQGRRFRR